MNHNYKVVFNTSTGEFTAVAEYAKAQGKSANKTVRSGGEATESLSESVTYTRSQTA